MDEQINAGTGRPGKMSLIGKWMRVGGIAAIMVGALGACGSGEGALSTQSPTMAKTPTITEPNTPTAAPTETATPKPTETPEEPDWSLEIPPTVAQCTNVIRSDTYAHTEEDIASLNKKIMEHKWFLEFPVGEFPPRTQQMDVKAWMTPSPKIKDIVPYSLASVDMWFNYQNADGSDVNAIIPSCSKYKDGYLFGVFIDINQQMVPVQVFIEPLILQNWVQYFINEGLDGRSYEQQIVEDYQKYSRNGTSSMIDLFGEFEKYPKYKDSATGVLGTYLEQTYDYSNRIKRLFTGNADATEAAETIAIMQRIPLPGKVIYYSPDDK